MAPEKKIRHEKNRHSESEWMAGNSPNAEGANNVAATHLLVERVYMTETHV